MQNEEIKDKIRQTNRERYGCEHPSQSEEIKEKTKQTNIDKYGFECPLQNEEVKQKSKQTIKDRFGVENVLQSEEIQNKIKQINRERYGCDHPSQSEEIKQKKIETCNKNFGVDHPTQSEEIQNKIIETNRKKYGCERPLQNSDIMEKMSKNSYKLKDYTFPSGNQIKYQGYEHYALDELIQSGILEEEILNGCKNVPEVWYDDEQGKEHRYYVDIFIPSKNICIEVKSTYTITLNNEIIKIKQQALKEAGYECEIWVYNGKGEKVECYK